MIYSLSPAQLRNILALVSAYKMFGYDSRYMQHKAVNELRKAQRFHRASLDFKCLFPITHHLLSLSVSAFSSGTHL